MELRIGILAPLILLTGCGLPPALMVASYAADGISYVASGKSLTDHVLSALVQRDCALHRVVTEAILCRDDILGGIETLALAEGPATDDGGAIGLAPRRHQPRWGLGTTSLLDARDDEPAPETVKSDATYLVVSSFSYWVNSEHFAERYRALAPEVVPATVQGEIVYRVVTLAGPEAVKDAGLFHAWPLHLCRDVESVLAPCAGDRAGGVNIAALAR